ncbi:MAG TPA: triose-phosphate isomerase [Anaerolineae bacterium]|nr:triose-phosphate isomerase [Anaerolineae bacterium]
MRVPILAGNWKMNKTVDEALDLVRELRRLVLEIEDVEIVVCPAFVALTAVADALRGTKIKVGAQNMHWEAKGAFTGEVSPLMLKGVCDYVIIGHSERRQYFGEADESVNRKVKAALAHNLIPIMAVGENLQQNEAGQTAEVVSTQVRRGLAGIAAEQARGLVIAYEPVWAIGTGKAATGAGANSVVALSIRGPLAEMYGEEVAQVIRVQYGGSVTPANIAEFMSMPDLDGGLVGGASLKANDFAEIVKGTAKAKK